MREGTFSNKVMKMSAGSLNLSRGAIAMLVILAALSTSLILIGFKDYPGLHTVLDTGIFLLSGLLALLSWELGARSRQPFPKWIAISFAAASFSESVHAFVSIEWAGLLAPIAQAAEMLRPTTWPPATQVLPIGVGISVWLLRRGCTPDYGLCNPHGDPDGRTIRGFFIGCRVIPRPLGWGLPVRY
jgi:hypothetical protein